MNDNTTTQNPRKIHLAITVIFLFVLLSISTAAYRMVYKSKAAEQITPTSRLQTEDTVVLTGLQSYSSSSPSKKQEIMQIAEKRKTSIREALAATHNDRKKIGTILSRLALDTTYEKLNDTSKQELAHVIEHRITITGRLSETHEDATNSDMSSYTLTVPDNTATYVVYSAKNLGDVSSPKGVTISALAMGSMILVPDSGVSTITASATTTTSLVKTGIINVGVIIVRLPNTTYGMKDAFGVDITPANVLSRYITGAYSIKSYLEKVSYYGQSASGGTFQLASTDIAVVDNTSVTNTTSCDLYSWANAVTSKVSATILAKDRVMYIFPRVTSCKNPLTGDVVNGFGQVGDRTTWINGNLSLRTLSHELTHNQGSHHAQAIYCGDGRPFTSYSDTNCKWGKDGAVVGGEPMEYGDMFDVMGGGGKYANASKTWTSNAAPSPNGIYKNKLGWLSSSRVLSLTASTKDVTLLPLDAYATTGYQLIKIPASKFNSSDYYYLEFRRPVGIDQVYPITDLPNGGVLIRLYGSSTKLVSQGTTNIISGLIDANSPIDTNFFDRALKNPGTSTTDTYKDMVNSVVVKLLPTSSSSGAHVCIGVGDLNYCNAAAALPTPTSNKLNLAYVSHTEVGTKVRLEYRVTHTITIKNTTAQTANYIRTDSYIPTSIATNADYSFANVTCSSSTGAVSYVSGSQPYCETVMPSLAPGASYTVTWTGSIWSKSANTVVIPPSSFSYKYMVGVGPYNVGTTVGNIASLQQTYSVTLTP